MDEQSQQQLEVSQDQTLAAIEKKLSPAEVIIRKNGKSAQGRR